jgi:hypothetical protein
MTTYGTAYFTSLSVAVRYYDRQNIGMYAVQDKVRAGEIFIGKPEIKEGERLFVDDGRYHIETND